MILRYLFLFILFASEFIVAIMLLKRKCSMKMVVTWLVAVFAVGYILASVIQLKTIFAEQYKISAYEDKSPLSADNQVHLYKIRKENRDVKEKNITAGWWWNDGTHLIYDDSIEGMTDEIVIDVPVGSDREIVFTIANNCGIVRIDALDQDFCVMLDTYCETEGKLDVSIPSSSRKMLFLDAMVKTALFCIGLGLLELLLYYLILKLEAKKDKITNRTKYWLIIALGFSFLFLRYVGPPPNEVGANYRNLFYFENYELGFLSRGLIGQLICEISPYWTELQLYLLKMFLAIVFTSIVCLSVSRTLDRYFELKAALFVVFFLVFQPLTCVLFCDRIRLDICFLILFLLAVLAIVGKTYFMTYLPLLCILLIFVNETTCLTIVPSILALTLYKYVSTEDRRYKWSIICTMIASVAAVCVTVTYGKGGSYSLEDTFAVLSSHYANPLDSDALLAEYFTLQEHFEYAYSDYVAFWQEHLAFWLLLIPIFYLIACLYKAVYVQSICHKSKKIKVAFALLIIASFSSVSAMMIAIDYGRYMLLVFVILMANYFAVIEQEKVPIKLADIYLFNRPQGENIMPFIVLVFLAWICPFYDTIISSTTYIYSWVDYFKHL